MHNPPRLVEHVGGEPSGFLGAADDQAGDDVEDKSSIHRDTFSHKVAPA
jgi:hypothetical protein